MQGAFVGQNQLINTPESCLGRWMGKDLELKLFVLLEKSWLCPWKEVSNYVELSLYTASLWASQLVS